MDDVEKLITELMNKGNDIEKIIKPFLSDNLSEKQVIEICHVGRFLSLLNNQAEIIQRRESPDFIISINGENIGLEHERIFNEGNVKSIKSTSKLFSDAAILFTKRYPEFKLLANFWLNTSRFEFKKKDSMKLKSEIVDYTYSQIMGNDSAIKPVYIDHLTIMKHSKVSFNYNPGAYYVNDIKADDLKKAILKKEVLLNKYKSNTSLDKQWLLVVIGATSPDSFEYGDEPILLGVKSNFDNVYVMEDFNAKIWKIK